MIGRPPVPTPCNPVRHVIAQAWANLAAMVGASNEKIASRGRAGVLGTVNIGRAAGDHRVLRQGSRIGFRILQGRWRDHVRRLCYLNTQGAHVTPVAWLGIALRLTCAACQGKQLTAEQDNEVMPTDHWRPCRCRNAVRN